MEIYFCSMIKYVKYCCVFIIGTWKELTYLTSYKFTEKFRNIFNINISFFFEHTELKNFEKSSKREQKYFSKLFLLSSALCAWRYKNFLTRTHTHISLRALGKLRIPNAKHRGEYQQYHLWKFHWLEIFICCLCGFLALVLVWKLFSFSK